MTSLVGGASCGDANTFCDDSITIGVVECEAYTRLMHPVDLHYVGEEIVDAEPLLRVILVVVMLPMWSSGHRGYSGGSGLVDVTIEW